MKGTTFRDYIRTETHTNEVTYPDTKLLLHANIVKDYLAEKIQSRIDEGFFEITETRSLLAGQREYAFPKDLLLSLKKAWIKIEGEWIVMKEFDMSQYDGVFENEAIKKAFGLKEPRFEITGRGMRIYSGADIEDTIEGLKILGSTYPTDLVADDLAGNWDLSQPQNPNKNKKHGMPRASHLVWAGMVVKMNKKAKDKPIDTKELDQSLKIDLEEMLENLSVRNRDSSFVPTIPFNDGSQY